MNFASLVWFRFGSFCWFVCNCFVSIRQINVHEHWTNTKAIVWLKLVHIITPDWIHYINQETLWNFVKDFMVVIRAGHNLVFAFIRHIDAFHLLAVYCVITWIRFSIWVFKIKWNNQPEYYAMFFHFKRFLHVSSTESGYECVLCEARVLSIGIVCANIQSRQHCIN